MERELISYLAFSAEQRYGAVCPHANIYFMPEGSMQTGLLCVKKHYYSESMKLGHICLRTFADTVLGTDMCHHSESVQSTS